ncbi:uncharacterized protein I303_106860 [Kwoniella dejecticola CBS 10117]|uniref:Uncharacterized protein n=1 Tax=Kwoniella dejecticola CBS 10117 TaxID=1296121 RepID=A0A1A5ZTH0_9TREE|nr:uncharacterized protein I303_08499 [Kwoniella dejecticola CBS 10117]OBR81116.1 hypothetical protein I303_08499 [Kwoniella dejecticola CBS 10117]
MGNKQSTASDPSTPSRPPTKSKKVKQKDFKILNEHRPPAYTTGSPYNHGLESPSERLRRELIEIDGMRANVRAKKEGDVLPPYQEKK